MTELTDFNLPPGVRVSDLPGYDEPPQYRCSCGAFLRERPDKITTTHTKAWCDGKVHGYKAGYDEGTIAILGESYRQKIYEVKYVQCEQDLETNIREHDAHWYDSYYDDILTKFVRVCKRCGKRNERWE